MKKLLIITAIALVLLVGALVSAWWWLTSTQSGASWALNRASGMVPSLQWQSLSGGLRHGLTLESIRLDEADTEIRIGRLELSARIRLLPSPVVDVNWLRANDVDIRLAERDPPDPDAAPFELPDISAPVPIRVHELRVTDLRLLAGPDQAEPLVVERIALVGKYHERLELESLAIDLPDSQLRASGFWQLKAPFSGQLDISAAHDLDQDLRQQVELVVDGRLALLDIELTATGPADVEGQVRLRGLPSEIDASVDLSGRFGDWPDLDLSVEDLNLNASGGPDAWQARLTGRFKGMDLPDNHLRADLSGSTRRIEIEELIAEVFDGEINASGQLDLDPELSARLDVALSQLDMTTVYPDWPEQARLQGRMQVHADARTVQLEELALSAPPTRLNLQGSGRLDPEQDLVSLDLNWRNLDWPPVTDGSTPLFSSQSGRVRLDGALSDWQLELEAVLEALEHPAATIELSARGDDRQAWIDDLRVRAGRAGSLNIDGQLTWAPEPAGRLDIELIESDPGQFIHELPGQVSGRVQLEFDSLDSLEVDLVAIDGELRGQPLDGSGRLRISEELPEAGNLDLALGDNRMSVSSSDGRAWRWQLDARALSQLWPDIDGHLELEGQIQPFAGAFDARGRFGSLFWNDIALADGEFETAVSWQDPVRFGLELKLRDLDLNPWERLDTLELSLSGDCSDHRFGLVAQGRRANLDLGGTGVLPNCLQDIRSWHGAMERLYLANTLAGDWELNQPMAIQVSAEQIQAEGACLVESATREGQLCLRSLTIDGDSRAEVGIEKVPMDLLLVPIDPTFHLTTPLSGELSVAWSPEGLEDLAGFLKLEAGAITPLDDDRELLRIESMRLDLNPATGRLILDFEALLEGDSQLNGQATFVDLKDPGSAEIDALARLNLPDIGVFNRLVPEIDQLGGRLEGELLLRGPLLAPAFQGHTRLREGLVVHAPLGLKVSDIDIALTGENDEGHLTGRMLSGDGHLNINGRIDQRADQTWQFEISADGERFAFADIDWLRLNASPQVRLSGSEDALEIDGDIRIDRLRGGMPPGVEERVTASEDIRVIGEADEEEELTDQRLTGRLGIHLGDDARLSAMGMQTQLTGEVELIWEPQSAIPRGRGLVRLPQGSYRAYGQNLEIRDGEILFTGHALDNPRMDIRATRDIFGDPQVEEAGVHIRGNAQNPVIELFTNPPTSEEKALAYVVTGADFDHAGGQGAINVGFYLLPRLFVSYGIGLFEAGNVLSGRYELSQRWGVRVVSGERDTGVDLSFAIDR
jgi:translocation and assembly module TamB